MTRHSKLVKSFLFLSSVLIVTPSTYADVKGRINCPVLKRDELRALCRWKVLSYFPGVRAGTVKFPHDITLKNTLGACWQKHDIKHYIYTHTDEAYTGRLGAYLKKGKSITVCTYAIPGEKVPHSFEAIGVSLPPQTPPPPLPSNTPETFEARQPPAKKRVMGFDMSGGGRGEIELRGAAPRRPVGQAPALPSESKPFDPSMPPR